MSMAITDIKWRIWFIDKLCPNLTVDEVKQMATDFCNEVYDNAYSLIVPDERCIYPEGREPNYLKFELQNNEVLNVFEQYIEEVDTTSRCFDTLDEYVFKYKKHIAIDYQCRYDGPLKRYIYICGKPVMKFFVDFDESKCDEYITRQEPELEGISIGVGFNHEKWIVDNPEWDFKKIVLDRIEPYIINAELTA